MYSDLEIIEQMHYESRVMVPNWRGGKHVVLSGYKVDIDLNGGTRDHAGRNRCSRGPDFDVPVKYLCTLQLAETCVDEQFLRMVLEIHISRYFAFPWRSR